MDTKLLIQSIEALEDTPEKQKELNKILVKFIANVNSNVRLAAETSRTCKEEWQKRLGVIENHVLGIGGNNGFRSRLKDAEERLEKIEDEVQKWIVRITTALIIFNTMVLPLIIYVILHILTPVKP